MFYLILGYKYVEAEIFKGQSFIYSAGICYIAIHVQNLCDDKRLFCNIQFDSCKFQQYP